MTNYIDQAQIAEAVKCAIDLEHSDVVAILGAHVQATVCEITTDDDEPEELSDNGAMWVTSAHSLVIEGVTVAEWSRCSVGLYDSNGDWHVEEDTNGGDTLPHIVYDLIAAIGLDDHTPDVPEPTAPAHEADPDGDYCVYWDTVGDDSGPCQRYSTLGQAAEMCAVSSRRFARSNPSGGSTRMLCGYDVRELVDGIWQAVAE